MIDDLPTPAPARSLAPPAYIAAWDAFFGALPTFVDQANALATTVSGQATDVASDAEDAAAAAGAAGSAETAASGSATTAAGSATAAAGSATAASGSATAASGSATAAAASATNAATSETNASASALAAAAALIAAVSASTVIGTRAQAALITVPSVLQSFATSGDTVVGVGPMMWKRVGSSPSHLFRFQDASGAWFEGQSDLPFPEQAPGLGGGLGGDDTAAIRAVYGYKGQCFFRAIDYTVSDSIDLTALPGPSLIGMGFNAGPGFNNSSTRIISTATNKPIFKLTGAYRVSALVVGYQTQQTTSNSASLAFELHNLSGASMRDVRVYNANTSWGIPQSAFGSTTFNTVFDVDFANLYSLSASEAHYDFRNYAGGGTNVRMGPLYCNGGGALDWSTTGQTANYAFRGVNWSGWELGAISIDGLTVSQSFFDLVNSTGFRVPTVRFEASKSLKDGGGWFEINGGFSDVSIDYLEVNNCRALTADGVTTTHLFRCISTDYELRVGSINITSTCTFTSTVARVLSTEGTGSASQVWIGEIRNDASGFNKSTWDDTTGLANIVRQWDGAFDTVYRKQGSTTTVIREELGSAIPTSGAYNAGDRVINASPGDHGRVIGWVCIASGSPGTWAPMAQTSDGGMSDFGDVDTTFTPLTSRKTFFFSTPLTTNRTVTLSTTGVWDGCKLRVTRDAAASGASTLSVGGLKLLAAGAWCDVQYDGFNWKLTAAGSL